jgi:short-subunit dehydrogenase
MNKSTYNIVVFGGSSAIAQAILRAALREYPVNVLLIGRNLQHLQNVENDLKVRGAAARSLCVDPSRLTEDWDPLLASANPGPVDLFVIAHGELPDQKILLREPAKLATNLQVNFVSAAVIASACIRLLEKQERGTLAILGSVAGDRGRASNFVYGSAKAGLDTLLEGWRHRLAGQPGIRVVTIKPGLTDTPMTANLQKSLLFTSADKVGALAWKAIKKGRPVAYIPGWWRVILTLIRLTPRRLFYRTKL